MASYEWLKLYTKGWLTGSIRIQLTPAERSVWADLLCLASECRRRGIIEHAPGIPYTAQEMAHLFNVPLDIVESTIIKCCMDANGSEKDGDAARIEIIEGGSIKIGNWERYQYVPANKLRLDAESSRELDNIRARKLTEKCPDVVIDKLVKMGKIDGIQENSDVS